MLMIQQDYHTRRVAVAETTVDGREVAVASYPSFIVG